MPEPTRDIYGTREESKGNLRNLPVSNTEAERVAWERVRPRLRWATAFFFLIVLALIGVFVGILLYQQRLLDEARSVPGDPGVPPDRRMPVETRGEPFLPGGLPVTGTLILDDLVDFQPAEWPAEGAPDLTPHWVLQAAYNLMQGDRYYGQREWTRAIDAYRDALRILPGIRDLQKRIGLAALQLKDYAAAEAAFRLAMEDGEPSAGLLNNLGVALTGLENYAEADALFRRAMEKDATYSPSWYNSANMLYRAGRMEEAARAFASWREQFPKDVRLEGLELQAMALMAVERWTEAAKVLRECTDTNPDVAPLYFRLAEAEARAGELDRAIAALRRGVRMVDAKRSLAWLSETNFDVIRNEKIFKDLVADLAAGREGAM